MKFIMVFVLAATLALVGCSGKSKSDRLAEIQTQVEVITAKVNQLQDDVNYVKQDSYIARGDAARANQRLDNQAKLFRK